MKPNPNEIPTVQSLNGSKLSEEALESKLLETATAFLLRVSRTAETLIDQEPKH